jgi:hypothetical protein
MSNSEEPVRLRTLRVILDIDMEELAREQYQSIFGLAKDLGMSVPECAAEALRVAPASDVALCIRKDVDKSGDIRRHFARRQSRRRPDRQDRMADAGRLRADEPTCHEISQ